MTTGANKRRPRLGLTMGDPAGIGPEVCIKALLAEPALFDECIPVIIGDRRVLAAAALGGKLRDAQPQWRIISHPVEAEGQPGIIEIIDLANADPALIPSGQVNPLAGRAAVEYIKTSVRLALAGEIDGIVTAPLNKEAMNLAGFHYAGHTELLTELTGSRQVAMMLTHGTRGGLRVVHVSTHVSMLQAQSLVKRERVLTCIRLARRSVEALGITQPRIAVAGFNAHAGENGLFGNEEIEEVTPAIQLAQAEGILASGPYPPDTIFLRANKGEFDAVVAMYHDQGHIPMKLLGFDLGVNVSVGLPIIRTSVDHGTAFDIAGQGIANEESMIEAIRVAVQMVAAKAAAGAS